MGGKVQLEVPSGWPPDQLAQLAGPAEVYDPAGLAVKRGQNTGTAAVLFTSVQLCDMQDAFAGFFLNSR